MLLTLLIFAPIIGGLIAYFAGFVSAKLSKAITIAISAATIGLTIYIFIGFNWTGSGFQFVESYDWATSFGLT